MKVSELITELRKMIAIHGDLPVVTADTKPLKSVSPWHDDEDHKREDDCKYDSALVIS